ncbi:hypothetical protein JCM17380_35570 [Desulfosporosinus burensis]
MIKKSKKITAVVLTLGLLLSIGLTGCGSTAPASLTKRMTL